MNFHPLQILCIAIALLLIALGLSAPAQAGPMDQGEHILVGFSREGTFATLGYYRDKTECLAARDDLRRQLGEFNSRKEATSFLACIPGRNT